MKFSELEKCPFCGSDEYYIKSRVSGVSCFMERFDGEEADNTEMYDNLSFSDNGRAYCRWCNKYLGNKEKNIVGKNAKEKILRRMKNE